MKKSFRVLTVLIALTMIFAAFGASGLTAKAQGATELVMLGNAGSDAEKAKLDSIIATYNSSQKDIHVTFNSVPSYDETLQAALAGGTPPDVFWVAEERFRDLVEAGQLAPIGDKLTDPRDFYPSLADVFTANGKFYCPPKDFSVLALQINTDMFAKAGVKPPTTWDELQAAAKALTTDKVAGIVLSPAFDRYGAWLYQAGGSVTDDGFTKMTINTPEGLAAMKYYTGLYTAGYAKTPTDLGAGWGGEAFGKGLTAIGTEGNWVVPFLAKSYPDLKYQSIPLPAGPKGQASLLFTVCYAVAANGKHIDAATKFVDYLVGKQAMADWTSLGFLPTRQSLRDDWVKQFPDLKVYLDSANFGHKWQFVPGFNLVSDEANKQIQNVFAGSQTADNALKAIEKAGNDALKKHAGGGGAPTMAPTAAAK